MARLGRRGEAWKGVVWLGEAQHGRVWRGMVWLARLAWLGLSGRG